MKKYNKWTNESIDLYLIKNNRKIKRIGNYENIKTKLEWECLIDGFKWCATIQSLIIKNRGCRKCSKHELWNNERVDDYLTKNNIKIKRIGQFVNSNDPIEWECLIDGFKWYSAFSKIYHRGDGCKKCSNNLNWNNERVDDYLTKNNIKIKRIGTVVNGKLKIEWMCLLCNEKWNTPFRSIVNDKSGCPNCKNKNEKRIKDILLKNCTFNIFEYQKRIRIGTKLFIIDFYLENLNSKKIIIEYNGQQHYKPVRFDGISIERAIKKFEKQQKRDEELRQYCKENDIYLLEIPYDMSDESIIKELNKLNNV